MKITILSEKDYAGSGHKLWEVLRPHHDVEIYTGKYKTGLGHPNHSQWSKRALRDRVEASDIIHVKGDFPVRDGYMGLRLMHKKTVQTTSGSHARKIEHGGHGHYHPAEYKATIKTSFEPDLLYPEYSDIWTPHPIDSEDKEIEWNASDPPLFIHSPTRRQSKGTDFMTEVFNSLKTKVDVEIIEGVKFTEAIRQRKRATIFFDQFKVGFYGNSALEAMQYGIPVAAWISPLSRSQAKGKLVDCPVITTDLRVDAWVKKIEQVLNSDLEELSRQTKIWCDAIHGYSNIANQWNEIYSV